MTKGRSDQRLLAAFDVGNTNVVAGLWPIGGGAIEARLRVPTIRENSTEEWGRLIGRQFRLQHVSAGEIGGVVVASVVPRVDQPLSDALRALFGAEPLFVTPGSRSWMPISVDCPSEVGADRLVNALAARTRWGAPVIVADFGTATTLDVVDRSGAYAGGVIAPGVALTAAALSERTAKLPRVSIVRPARAIGRGTVAAMQSGLYFGTIAMIEGMVARLSAELGARPPLVATGGLSALFAKEPGLFTAVDPDLTLEGLALAWRMSEETSVARRRRPRAPARRA